MTGKTFSENEIKQHIEDIHQSFDLVKNELHKIIIGQHEVVDLLLLNLLAGGHSLIMGVPGLAKTLMIKTVARTLDLSFNRIQFTPDLMPADITGTEIIEEQEDKRKKFRFIEGPLFSNIVLADEINRTPPKTQAALLEAMQELRVTVSGQSYSLPQPFFVLATQNPIEQEGTYPLPEAQLDRFLFLIKIDYPSIEEEKKIVSVLEKPEEIEVSPVLSGERLIHFQTFARHVPVPEPIIDFCVRLVALSRPENSNAPEFTKKWINWGAGPRAAQALVHAARSHALLRGRSFPIIEDVKAVLYPVLRHRILLNFSAEAESIKVESVIDQLWEETVQLMRS